MKRSRWLKVFAGLAAIGLFAGCASTSIQRLSGDEFIGQAEQISQINSFHWTSYIGCSRSRAYLEYGYPALIGKGTRTTLYWVYLSDLPDEISGNLREGNPPWKSWTEREENRK